MKRQFYEVPPQYLRGPVFHKNRLRLSSFIFGFSFFLALTCLAFPPFRYLAYSVPVLVLLACMADGRASIGDEVKPFLVIIAAGVMLGPLTKGEGWKDLFFIFAGVSVALLGRVPRISLWSMFGWLMVSFVYLYGVWGDFRGGFHYNFLNSESTFEGNFSFVFALLVPFAVHQRKYLLAFLCLAMAVLTLKRIAILAAVVSSIMVLIGPKRGKLLLNPATMVGLNAFVLLADMAYTTGMLDYFIQQLTGQSSNQLGMGRQSMHKYVVDGLLNEPWWAFLGHGLGSVYSIAEQGFGVYEKVNLHSDLLKLCYEIGYICTAAVFWLMYAPRSYMIRVAFFFQNMLFFTDNTLIYFFLTYFIFLLMRIHRDEDELSHEAKPAAA